MRGSSDSGRNVADQKLADVARRFEALFVEILLKSARTGAAAEGLLEGKHTKTYQQMLDRQWAQQVSRSGSLGIAEILVRQLGSSQPSAVAQSASMKSLPRAESVLPQRDAIPSPPRGPVQAIPEVAISTAPRLGEPADIAGPVEFVRQLWHPAVQAAARLGVAPQVLIAQAALETGWGRSLPTTPGGGSSFNLFGIKAHSSWPGPQATVTTVEFMDGVAIKVQAPFRAYDSYRASFEDYADFLQGNKRYRQALESAGDPIVFVQALQNAGYATDPRYAQKIRSILEGPRLRDALDQHLSHPNPSQTIAREPGAGTTSGANG